MSGGSIKFMTYNVWSCEHVAVYRWIQSICEIIEQHEPDVIFLHVIRRPRKFLIYRLHSHGYRRPALTTVVQEVTDYIYSLFQEAPWWVKYTTKVQSKAKSVSSNSNPASFCLVLSKLEARNVVLPEYCYFTKPHFRRAGSIPHDLVSAWVYTKGHRLRASTCRFASPTLSDIGSLHRRDRTCAFLQHFDAVHQPVLHERSFVLDENVVLGGDLGWDEDLDGPLRLGDGGWVDAWLELRGDGRGWTYDAEVNPMLMGFNLPADRRRPDRFICKLRDFTLESIEMIGVDAIPGVTRLDDKGYPVPVVPSHHFGLLLTIKPKPN